MKRPVQTMAIIMILILSAVLLCGCPRNVENSQTGESSTLEVTDEVIIEVDETESAGGM